MKLRDLEKYITSLFDTTDNENFEKESGTTVRATEDVRKIGYCTNLTLETVEEARKNGVDLMITHHDAWDFIFGLRESCEEKLREYGISHYFNHLPLDDCNFGTNDALVDKLGARIVERTHVEDGFYCGRVVEFDEPVAFDELVERLEGILEEPVRAWDFKEGMVKRVGLVCGGGGRTTDVREAFEKDCDVYITGESVLYTIEYAQLIKMGLIIGSHTFTEVFGVESFVNKITEEFSGLEVVRLKEEHLEVNTRK